MQDATLPPHQIMATASCERSWDREVLRFIDAGGNTTHSFGLGRLLGRIFALLYLSPEPLCLEQISERLRISKASASIAVRQLASCRAVKKIESEGDRRDFYEVELNFGTILRNGLLPGIRKKFQSAGVQIERTLVASPVLQQVKTSARIEESSRHKEICRRLEVARGLHQKIDSLLSSPLLDQLL
jgi:DNA-binding transcriptional regulator GbsR (MarR family)